jgi:hypothetical protein
MQTDRLQHISKLWWTESGKYFITAYNNKLRSIKELSTRSKIKANKRLFDREMKVIVLLTINFDEKVVNFLMSKLHGHV